MTFVRQMPSQQAIEQMTQTVDIRRHREGLIPELLRRGTLGCEHGSALELQHGLARHALVSRQHFRDAEVQKLRFASGRHEHVGRLDVSMNDSLRLHILDRRADLEHQLNAGSHIQTLACTVFVDAFSLDMLEKQEGVIVQHAGVHHPCNTRMTKCRVDAALLVEPSTEHCRCAIASHDLHDQRLARAAIVARCEKYMAHAAGC
jgi:hypothetical protein